MVTTDIKDTILHPSFKNNFWNAEIGNFLGFDVLVKRSKESRTLGKDFTDYIKQRAQIEEQYGKSLLKLAKLQVGGEEFGPLRKIWDTLRDHTEAVGVSHSQAAQQLENETGCVHEFLESSKDRRRWAEENVRTLQTQMKTAHKRMLDLRKLYECRCREEVQASHSYHQEVARGGEESGGADKAATRHSKARSSMESAQTAYRGSVDYLQEVKELWEKETESTAEVFQELETTRLSLLRDSIWKLTNVLSSVCVTDDEAYEDTRKVLETSDIEEGVQLFIAQHQTGTKRPGAIKQESIPTSSTIGMGHARQYESGSLSRAKHFSSLGHLVDAGRSRSDLGFMYKEAPARPKKPPRLHTYEPPRDTYDHPRDTYEPPRDTAILVTRNNNNKDDSTGDNLEAGLVSGKLVEPAVKPAMKHHIPATRNHNQLNSSVDSHGSQQSAVSRNSQHNMQSAVGSRDSQHYMQSAVGSRDRQQAVTAGNTVHSLRNGHSGQVVQSGQQVFPAGSRSSGQVAQSSQQVVPAGSRSRRSQSRDRLERHTIPICIENSEYYGMQHNMKQSNHTLPSHTPSPVKHYNRTTSQVVNTGNIVMSSAPSTPLTGTMNKRSSNIKPSTAKVTESTSSRDTSASGQSANGVSAVGGQATSEQPQGKPETRSSVPSGKISCGSESSDSSSQDSGKYSAESSPRYYPPASPSPRGGHYYPSTIPSSRHRRASSSPTRSPPFTSTPYTHRNGGGGQQQQGGHHLARPSPASSPYRSPGAGMNGHSANHYRSPSQPPTPSQYRHDPHANTYRSSSVARAPVTSQGHGQAYRTSSTPPSNGVQRQPMPNMATMRRARVLCEYKQKSNTEVSLPRNELVWVVEGEEGEEWWFVRSEEAARGGYFPAHFLRVIDSPT